MTPANPHPSRPGLAHAGRHGTVSVYEHHEPIPPRVWALWIGSLLFVAIVTIAIMLHG